MAKKIIFRGQLNKSIVEVFDDFVVSQTARGLSEITLATYHHHIHSISNHLDIQKTIADLERAIKHGKTAVGLLLMVRLVGILASLRYWIAIGTNIGSVILYLLMDIVLFYMPIALAGYVMQPVEQDILEFISTDPVREIADLEAKLKTNAISAFTYCISGDMMMSRFYYK